MSQCNPDFDYVDFDPIDFEGYAGFSYADGEDFDPLDFDPLDFVAPTTGLRVYFKNFMFSLLPWYFRKEDTYKDHENKGLLERYISIFGHEIDEEIIPKIECYLNIIVAQDCESKFLIHLSDVLGNPPDVFNNEPNYRNLLTYIVSIYKIKGTIGAYELFFGLLGFDIELVEIEPINPESQYDNLGQYDTGEIDSIYDQTKCTPCSGYSITFYPKNINNLVLEEGTLEALQDAIEFNEPINARLVDLTFAIRIEDRIGVNVKESYTEAVEISQLYDTVVDYDTDEDYDAQNNIGTEVLQTDISITPINLGGNNYRMELKITDNFTPEEIELSQTTFTIQCFNLQNEIIESVEGGILNYNHQIAAITGIIASYSFNVPNLVSMRIIGQLVLTDNSIATLDNNINISNTTDIPLYFIQQ